MNAVPGARTQTTLPLSPPQSNMVPPSEDNGKVKKDITRLPWRCVHHIRVIYTVNGMLLCLGYGCSSASPPPLSPAHTSGLAAGRQLMTRFCGRSTRVRVS